jgi:hypothetical protein
MSELTLDGRCPVCALPVPLVYCIWPGSVSGCYTFKLLSQKYPVHADCAGGFEAMRRLRAGYHQPPALGRAR